MPDLAIVVVGIGLAIAAAYVAMLMEPNLGDELVCGRCGASIAVDETWIDEESGETQHVAWADGLPDSCGPVELR